MVEDGDQIKALNFSHAQMLQLHKNLKKFLIFTWGTLKIINNTILQQNLIFNFVVFLWVNLVKRTEGIFKHLFLCYKENHRKYDKCNYTKQE